MSSQALKEIRTFIVDYQNYEGAKVLAKRGGISDSQVRKLVGKKLYGLYKMDPQKRFNMKVKRGFWRD